VARPLGIRDLPSVAAADALAQALARRQLLLVLDNCGHVIGAAAELCGRLLLGADDVRVLATSRELLRIAGEVRYRLGPLTLPGDATGDWEAVTLFTDRARQVEPGFVLDEETGAAVARLVARLDGMPLAIELAAARVDALGVAQLLDRIDDRFGLLTDGYRLAEERQRSLAAAVRWSYQLLDGAERRVFRAVSVFPGPFTLDGAEAVTGPGAGRVVLRLVDCSLLLPPQRGPDGRSRYAMLETLRAFGAGLLAEAGEEDQIGAALAAYAAEVAGRAAAELYTGSQEVAGVRYLDAEEVTLRHALAWASDHDPAAAMRLTLALAPWWRLRGCLSSQAPLLAAAVEYAEAGSDEWCSARMFLGQVVGEAEDPPTMLEHFTAVRDAGDEIAARLYQAQRYLQLGRVEHASRHAWTNSASNRVSSPERIRSVSSLASMIACTCGVRSPRLSWSISSRTARICGTWSVSSPAENR
jgi:predicted ATPase